ncbi:MAG: heme-binding protein, partial [Verrucomicrobiota bacterium]
AGNFYFNKGGNLGWAKIPHHGSLIRVSKDGRKLEAVANGLRAPNGIGVGPRDEITTSDNEGNWVPACRVNLMKPGGFYGHVFTAHTVTPHTNDYDGPLFWIPKNVDNSSGGQFWVTSDRWGPFQGDLLHTSYGMCSLFKCFYESVDGIEQGGLVRFPLKFDSGIMRGRFSPRDGQLYTCGLVVWQSNGAKQGAFHRVRYTGKPVTMVRDLRVKANGVVLTFTRPLDKATVSDLENYAVDRWNYDWAEHYGSPEFSVKEPARKGHDPVAVKSARLSADGKTLSLELEDVIPVMQQRVKLRLKGADGADVAQEVWHTIHKVPSARLSGS